MAFGKRARPNYQAINPALGPSDPIAYLAILDRVGWVLIAVGIIDIGFMIYCIAQKQSYSSSFNIFSLIAGIFLVRGSLRAASLVRRFGMFMLTGMLGILVAFPFLEPFGLIVEVARLYPAAFITTSVFAAFGLGLLFWVVRELGKEPVQAALATSGQKRHDARIPAAAGIGLVVVLVGALSFTRGGQTAKQAMSMAETQVGPGYRFCVTSIGWSSSNGSKSVSAVVTAWNEKEIRNIPVHWETK